MPTINEIAPESVFTIELNAGAQGRQGPRGEQGVRGIQGPRGETGPKPIRGIDYFTQQDISNMVTTITGNSNSAFNENVSVKTKEFNNNVSAKTSAFDNNAVLKTEEFNTNANTKKTDFNLNSNNKTTEFNTNASEKKNEIDTYVENKTTEFDNHVVEKINEFKEETSEFITENELESKGYLVESDLNGYAKEKDLFSGSYNDLKDKPKIPSKTSELTNDEGFINAIPSEYVTEEEQKEFIKPYNNRITETEKYISDLESTIDILTNTNKAKGELVHITDALPLATFENKVDGNVKQFTTKGYNLIDIQTNNYIFTNVNNPKHHQNYGNGILLDYDYDKDYTYHDNYRFVHMYYPMKADKYYCLSAIVTKLGTVDANVYVYLPSITQYGDIGKPFKPNEDTEWISFYVQLDSFKEGFKYAITDVILQEVESATATPKPYEKYTGNQASPNPEYPQEIEVVEGDLSYKVNGKNLLSVDMFIDNTIPSINTGQNVSGAGNTATSYIEIDNSLPLIYSTSQTGKGKYAFYYDENYNYLGYKVNTAEAYLEISNADYYKNAKYIRLRLDGLTKETIEKAQLEYNSTATEYEPYKEQIVPLDLKGNFVGKINDTIKDYLVTDKKKYWLDKFVGERIFTGDENWIYLDNRGNYYRYYLLNFEAGSGVRSILCNYFTDRGNKVLGEYAYIQLTANDLYIQIENVKTLSELKNLLKEKYESGNPVKVLYPLAKPYTEELGELPELIKTFEGVNNIQLLANLDTEIEVMYALDVKKYYDNKLASIQEQIL